MFWDFMLGLTIGRNEYKGREHQYQEAQAKEVDWENERYRQALYRAETEIGEEIMTGVDKIIGTSSDTVQD